MCAFLLTTLCRGVHAQCEPLIGISLPVIWLIAFCLYLLFMLSWHGHAVIHMSCTQPLHYRACAIAVFMSVKGSTQEHKSFCTVLATPWEPAEHLNSMGMQSFVLVKITGVNRCLLIIVLLSFTDVSLSRSTDCTANSSFQHFQVKIGCQYLWNPQMSGSMI